MPRARKLSTTATIGIGVGAGLVLLLAGGYLTAHFLAQDRLPEQTEIHGVAVGGMTPDQAVKTLQQKLQSDLDQPVHLTLGEQTRELAPAKAGLSVDWDASVSQADVGSTWDPLRLLTVFFGGDAHELVVKHDPAKLDAQLAQLASEVNHEPVNAQVVFKGTKPVVNPGQTGNVLDVAQTAKAVQSAFLSGETAAAVIVEAEPAITTQVAKEYAAGAATTAVSAPVKVQVGDVGKITVPVELIAQALSFDPAGETLTPRIDADKLASGLAGRLDELGLKVPKDASYTISKGKPKVVPSVDGVGVASGDLADAVLPALSQPEGRQVTVAVSARPANVTTADVKKLGVKQVIGSFTTYYPGSAYRVNNIGKAARMINGTFLMPGETFSMNQVLGKRSTAAGWMEGGAIDGGKVVTRMGGGISQATTTTFNAIFFAGLKDIYHKPHSLYFSRYPVGREATLDWVSVDMKFKNDTPYGVLMQAWTTGKTGSTGSITVRVWSTKQYTVKASKPVLSNYRSPDKVVYDTSKDCVPQSAMSGFDVKFNRLFYQGKKLVKSEPFKWSYNSLTPVKCGKDPDKKKEG